jgi:thiol-disulfide isomerase/thioredoxin
MTSSEINRIETWHKQVAQNISFTILCRHQHNEDSFYAFGQLMESICNHIHIDYHPVGDNLPEIQLKNNLHFHALPEGTELIPFLKALDYIIQPPAVSSEYQGIKELAPSHLKMFVSPHCPHCPSTLQQILPFVWLNPDIHLTIIDVGLFPEKAKEENIQSVPAIVYQKFLWTGSIQISEILDVIRNNPDEWHQDTLQRMLSEGKAEQLAEAVLEKGLFFDNFHLLIAHELLSVRLGAMVCVEYIAEENKALAQTLCDPIWQMIPEANVQVKGDLIYLMGICGTAAHIPELKKLSKTSEDDDITDAINEAIECIQDSGNTE